MGKRQREANQQWGGARVEAQETHLCFARHWQLPQPDHREPFSWAVAGDVMLLVVVRLHACQERHMEIFEVVRTNPGDAGLHAQFDQAAHEVVVVAAELRGLEARWGFRAPLPPPAVPYSASRFLGFEVRKKVVCFGCAIGCNGTKFMDTLQTLFAYTFIYIMP
jgi:hypothetical protein